jgi:hypothetical protein
MMKKQHEDGTTIYIGRKPHQVRIYSKANGETVIEPEGMSAIVAEGFGGASVLAILEALPRSERKSFLTAMHRLLMVAIQAEAEKRP